TGPGRLVPFQAAYVGGWTSNEPEVPRVQVRTLAFGPSTPWEEPEDAAPAPVADLGATDIRRLTDSIIDAATLADLPVPRRPWLPELAAAYDLAALPTRRTDTELVFGVGDNPDAQQQPVVSFNPDRDGSMVVYGTGGSGKSTFLRSMAIAAGLTARGGPCEVFAVDFGARGLAALESLPHVGSVISGEDDERIERLIRRLRNVIDDRARRYAAVNAGTITEYRTLANSPLEARILLLVDNLGAFRQAYETGGRQAVFDSFQTLAVDGRQVGVHVVVSADRPGAVPSALASSLQRRLVLRLANETDDAILGVPKDLFDQESPAGRGFIDNWEVQVAVLGGTSNVAEQAVAIEELAESMRRAGRSTTPPISRLPERVLLDDLPDQVDSRPILGVEGATLEAIGFPDTGCFLIGGPPRSGRTTTVASMLSALRRRRPDTTLAYFGHGRSPLVTTTAWAFSALDVDAACETAKELTQALTSGRFDGAGGAGPRLVVVIESPADWQSTAADGPLTDLVKAVRLHGQFVIAEGETGTMSASYGLLQQLKADRTGLALQPDQMDGDTLFRTSFPRLNRAAFPQGRGLLVQDGAMARVQVALASPLRGTR
ncbi:MAG: segregation ATPase FtsK/SpoIIIE, family, partial [Actinomycetota bacterium]|nr:segregation ATPase FtsK/SpoIIIE, family [Actinomycetota bacterium]